MVAKTGRLFLTPVYTNLFDQLSSDTQQHGQQQLEQTATQNEHSGCAPSTQQVDFRDKTTDRESNSKDHDDTLALKSS